MKFNKMKSLLEAEDPKKKTPEEEQAEKDKAEKAKEAPKKENPVDKEKPKEDKKPEDKPEEAPDPDEEFEKEEGADTTEEEEMQAAIEAKFEEIGDKVMKAIESLLDTKSSVILGKIKNIGIDETVLDFLENYFIKSLDNTKDKVFISLNMDELVPYIAQKISVEYLKK